eukprot:Colp12_sorted_trinity150504_noHs@8681
MAQIALRIICGEGLEKTVQFPGSMRIDDITVIVREKVLGDASKLDHLLYCADRKMWPLPNKTLDYYDFKSGQKLVLKKKSRPQKLRLPDHSSKKVMIDETLTCRELVTVICEFLNISRPHCLAFAYANPPPQYTLTSADEKKGSPLPPLTKKDLNRLENKLVERTSKGEPLPHLNIRINQAWLDPSMTLSAQDIGENDEILLKYRYFYKLEVDDKDIPRLEYVYGQGCKSYLDGELPVTDETVLTFSWLLLQLAFRNSMADKFTPHFLEKERHQYLPATYKVKNWKNFAKQLQTVQASMGVLDPVAIKLKFVEMWQAMDTYGMELYSVVDKNSRARGLFGVSHEKFVLVRQDQVTQPPRTWKIGDMDKYRYDMMNSIVMFDFPLAEVKSQYLVAPKFGTQILSYVAGLLQVFVDLQEFKVEKKPEKEKAVKKSTENLLDHVLEEALSPRLRDQKAKPGNMRESVYENLSTAGDELYEALDHVGGTPNNANVPGLPQGFAIDHLAGGWIIAV